MPSKATADYSESKFMKQREETRVDAVPGKSTFSNADPFD